ncbi:hypothetical protein N658DRAFT_415841, partial [Parathielavia hyrcaniae]
TREAVAENGGRSQCQQSQDFKSQGEKAAMSQGGSAPRPPSRPSPSRSPARATNPTTSPPLQQSRTQHDDQRPQPLRNSPRVAQIQADASSQEAVDRALDTRSILNPVGTHGELAGQFRSFAQPSAARGRQQPTMGAGQYERDASPARPASFQNLEATTPQSTMPPTTSPVGQPTSGGRGSPHTVHTYPTAARRILTPKSPRAVSLSRAAMRTMEAQHPTPSLPTPTSRGGPSSTHDAQVHGSGRSSLETPPQFYSPSPAQTPAEPSPTRPTSGLARSLSHPSLSHGLPSAHGPEPSQHPGSLKRERSGRPVLSGPPFAPPLLASQQPFGTSGVMGDTRWGPGILGSMSVGGARHLSITEGQPVLTITPSHGEEIVVPVDVHQGSKVADHKRQRNAGASARFRQRKKERERSQQEELQKLENANRELEHRAEELARRCEELEAQRDFYRNDRNRLREIMAQLPGGKEWAGRGPQSPISRTAGAAFASGSGGLLAQPPPPPAPHGHSQPLQHHPPPFPPPPTNALFYPHPPRSNSYGDASAFEPPARRRRTDSELQLSTGSYSLMTTSAPLPSISRAVAASPPPPPPPPPHGPPPPSFGGIPHSPRLTPPPMNARLPPLRFDQSRTPSTTPPPAPGPPPPPTTMPPPQSGSPYVTTRRLPYETGWATDPRPPATEGGPR